MTMSPGHSPSARNIDGIADGGSADRVPRRQHRCMRLPAVRRRIVTLHLTEHRALRNLTSLLHAIFAAHREEPAAVDDEAVAGTRRRQRRPLLPGVERGPKRRAPFGGGFENLGAFIHVIATFITRQYHRFQRNTIGNSTGLYAHWVTDRSAAKLQYHVFTQIIKQLVHLTRVNAA